MTTNIVNHIGNKVTVWHKTGNAMEQRTLLTVDDYGIAVTGYTGHTIYVPWMQINYVDLIQEEK